MLKKRAQKQNQRLRRERTGGAATGLERTGAVLVAVLWLMAALWVLGIFFFVFTITEQNSAQYYADAAKVDNRCGVSPDVLWDWALRQLIVGPKFDEDNDRDLTMGNVDSERYSALYAFDSAAELEVGPHSMLAHVLGLDLQAYNGQGVNLITDATGQPFVDQDFDGVADADQSLLDWNYSAAANGGSAVDMAGLLPAKDVGYTSPDIHAPFLAYFAPDPLEPTTQIFIPSFHRPQYLRDGAGFATQWDTIAGTEQRIFRAHKSNLSIDQSMATYLRFLPSAYWGPDGQPGEAGVDDDGLNGVDDNGEIGWPGTDDVLPFEFTTTDDGLNQSVINDGVWQGSASPGTYAYDTVVSGITDSVGTAIKDGVWLDLGFPFQECDGKRFVPLFSFTVFDADAYLNLNVAGNTTGTEISASGLDPTAEVFNQSNQALSPSELSLHYIFNAAPSSVVSTDPAWEPYKQLFGIDPATINSQVLANMETWFLLHGRGEYDTTPSLIGELVGRYGEKERLSSFLSTPLPANAPQAGRSLFDDDNDVNLVDSNEPNNTAAYNQPNDIRGAGTMTNDGLTVDRLDLGPDPNRWVRYTDYGVTSNNIGYDNDVPSLLNWLTSAPGNFNFDEADEIVLLSGFPDISQYDATFSAEEMVGLHRGANDSGADQIPSRLKELLKISLDLATESEEIRRQLTTISWDRVEFGLSAALSPRGRAWEWEWAGSNEFPPVTISGPLADDPHPPYREPVWQLLRAVNATDDNTDIGLQRRLDLNRHLYIDNAGLLQYRELTPHPPNLGGGTIPVGMPAYPPASLADQEYWARRDRQEKARDIYTFLYMFCGGWDLAGPDGEPGVAGVDDDGNGIMDDETELGWAGSDDVTYLISNVDNAISPPDADTLADLYTPEQLKQMAQFAVNVVDALDADNVISRFEYDTDLSNGWNMDDNPYDSSGDTVGERGVVDGVEAASLTFSEVIAIYAPEDSAGDNQATRYNENNGGDRRYVFIELRNASPLAVDLTDVDLSNTLPDPAWQIVYDPLYDPAVVPDIGTAPGSMEIINIHPNATAPALTTNVPAGGTYTIGTSGGKDYDAVAMQQRPSDFVVDWRLDGNLLFERILPRVAAGGAGVDVNSPGCNLDLVHQTHDGWSTTTDGNNNLLPVPVDSGGTPFPGGKGAFLQNITDGQTIRLHLRRLANPRLPFDPALNPWIIVDRFECLSQEFQLASGDGAATVQTKVDNLQTTERGEPLNRDDNAIAIHSQGSIAGGSVSNSLGNINEMTSNAPYNGAFRLWQPHFDRHFASVIELMSIPLYGPENQTSRILLPDSGLAPGALLSTLTTNPQGIIVPALLTDGRINRRLAQEKFLFPDFPDGFNNSPQFDNRWHRLFGFFEIPSRLHRGLGDITRVPGKININTVRHDGVLGAMLDEPLIHDLDLLSLDATDTGVTSSLAAGPPPPNRNWWREFVAARDAVWLPSGNLVGGNGLDPVTGRYVPAAPGSRPFRDLSFTDQGLQSIDHTLLRKMLADTDGRGLFEVGAGDMSANTDSSIDYYMRHRLLAKIANHATTRSHVFIVFIKTDYFEVVEPTAGQPQIGAKLSTSPGHRGFFIVDMSNPLANGAFTPGTPGPGGVRGRFDFRKFVKYRRTIE